MKKLPGNMSIIDQLAAPTGWFAYYTVKASKTVVALPIALWALVAYDDGSNSDDEDPDLHSYATQEYRPFVVSKLGAIVDFCEPDECELLCVLAPGIGVTHKEVLSKMISDMNGFSIEN